MTTWLVFQNQVTLKMMAIANSLVDRPLAAPLFLKAATKFHFAKSK